jgi:hypothetical protein
MELKSTNISRRELLAKGAVVGGILWAAPVIESVTSMAAAQSGLCSPVLATDSFIYVIYEVGSTIYFAGYINSSGTLNCGNGSKPTNGRITFSPCNGYTFIFDNVPSSGQTLTYTGSSTGTATETTCSASTYLAVSQGTVTAQGGATILGVICFGGNTGSYALDCPGSSSSTSQCAQATSCG